MNSKVIQGDALEVAKSLEKESIQSIITSPPYFQCRTYNKEKKQELGQDKLELGKVKLELGQEKTPEEFLKNLCDIFDALKPALKEEGCLWVNIGDSIAKKNFGDIKSGEQMMIPALFALEMRKRKWYIQQDVIWAKTNPMPSSTPKRCTPSHEYIFLFSKNKNYKFDPNAIKVPAKTGDKYKKKSYAPIGGLKKSGNDNSSYSGNKPLGDGMARKRDVWFETTSKLKESHFAPFPESIVEPCILASTDKGDTVLDPFCGSGTTGMVSKKNERNFIGIEVIDKYVEMANKRIENA